MVKIIAYILMISYIAPSDHIVFQHAIQMLINEFQPHFSENIIKQVSKSIIMTWAGAVQVLQEPNQVIKGENTMEVG